MADIHGSDDNDTLTGTTASDRMNGYDGNETCTGQARRLKGQSAMDFCSVMRFAVVRGAFSLVFSTLLSGTSSAEMTLPYEGVVNTISNAGITVTQTGKGTALKGTNVWYPPSPPQPPGAPPTGTGTWGRAFDEAVGVYGSSAEGYGGWFDSGKDHNDLVLGGAVGRLNSDPNNKDSVLIISSNRDISMRLDNDAGGFGVFRVENSGGNAVLAVGEDGHLTTKVLHITGGSDLAEPFKVAAAEAAKPGMLVSIDPTRIGQLLVSSKAYDRTVAGVISGANGLNPGLTMMGHDGTGATSHLPVALTGRVYTFADAANGPIEPGDLLTTSDTLGHAMKVTDHAMAQGAIIGKAMSPLTSGRGLVLVLVSLQ